MGKMNFHLHDGKSGAALAVRVVPRAEANEVVEVMADGSVKIRLATSADDQELNQALLTFLAEILSVPLANLNIVGGESGRSKLISVDDVDSVTANERIVARIS